MSDPKNISLEQLPDTPAGRQLAWWIDMIADEGARAGPADADRWGPAMRERTPLASADLETARQAWRGLAARLGAPAEVVVEKSADEEIAVVLTTAKDRKWTVAMTVEPEPPHRLTAFRFDRWRDFKLEVRVATEADALVLADVERRCPIVLGETAVWFDRGSNYFQGPRLMEDRIIGLASVDGAPAAVSCGAVRDVRIGGAMKRMLTVSHLRVLPEHQRKGLWGAANSVFDRYWPLVDGSQAYISVDNLGMQHGFANTPNKWPQIARRLELDCAALAGPQAGRAARQADLGAVVGLLNAFHDREEMYVPYTEASFAARLTRAPDLYSRDHIRMTDGAVVGVWRAGNAQRSVTETRGARTVTVPAVVLDYAFAPGAEAEFEGLLRAWCAELAPQGMDALAIFTSPASSGAELLRGLARQAGDFFVWTPGIAVPPDAASRGLYVDAVYF